MRKPQRFALFGAGYWARPQLAAWRELDGVECAGIYNRTRAKAEALGQEFNVPVTDDDPERLLRRTEVDFVDIVTDVSTHASLTRLAAARGLPVICQKPMAASLAEAEEVVAFCRTARTPFFVHENWRWQRPIRALHDLLRRQVIGEVFRATIDMVSGFPVFQQQPFLREVEQFIVADLGSHTFDTARFLFGEAHDVACVTGRVHPDIKGEDHATLLLRMGPRRMPVVVRMAYAENFVERECFPQTLFFVEGSLGTIEVAPDYVIRITTRDGTHIERHPPIAYRWVDPRYAVVQSSIVACHANLLGALRGEQPAETTGADNLRTVRLVHSAYASARTRQTISNL
jgi:D-apiose dehydrogenase